MDNNIFAVVVVDRAGHFMESLGITETTQSLATMQAQLDAGKIKTFTTRVITHWYDYDTAKLAVLKQEGMALKLLEQDEQLPRSRAGNGHIVSKITKAANIRQYEI